MFWAHLYPFLARASHWISALVEPFPLIWLLVGLSWKLWKHQTVPFYPHAKMDIRVPNTGIHNCYQWIKPYGKEYACLNTCPSHRYPSPYRGYPYSEHWGCEDRAIFATDVLQFLAAWEKGRSCLRLSDQQFSKGENISCEGCCSWCTLLRFRRHLKTCPQRNAKFISTP